MQAYLPGTGWIDFDPANGIIGNHNLIHVGVAWAPEMHSPASAVQFPWVDLVE
jgi:transglutaminase-like putative cysteine protease